MPELFNKENTSQCCGCSACFAVCPVGAITLQADTEGFLYPIIDDKKCIECNKCMSVCPLKSTHVTADVPKTQKYIALKHREKETILSSSSGGAFTAISDYILENGGVIYGVAFDENIRAVHIRADKKEIRDNMRVSKYVQSDLQDTFKQVKDDVTNGITVLFTGTPCQVAGIKKYLEKDYENFFTMDVICHGVPSPLMFSEHIKQIEKKKKTTVKSYKCRSKVKGWHTHIEAAEFTNGKTEAGTPLLQEHKVLFYSGYILRPSCYECKFTNLHRPADITMGDFWGIEKSMPDWDDQAGTSIVLVNTQKGEKLFENSKPNIHFRVSETYGRQPNLEKNRSKPADREQFWNLYYSRGYGYVSAKYGRNNLKTKIKFLVKKVIKK